VTIVHSGLLVYRSGKYVITPDGLRVLGAAVESEDA
jgi:hypothetical protein